MEVLLRGRRWTIMESWWCWGKQNGETGWRSKKVGATQNSSTTNRLCIILPTCMYTQALCSDKEMLRLCIRQKKRFGHKICSRRDDEPRLGWHIPSGSWESEVRAAVPCFSFYFFSFFFHFPPNGYQRNCQVALLPLYLFILSLHQSLAVEVRGKLILASWLLDHHGHQQRLVRTGDSSSSALLDMSHTLW